MKKILAISTLLLSGISNAGVIEPSCRHLDNLTYDQSRLLNYVYAYANDNRYNDLPPLGLTMAAIVWKESFVGSHIVVNNPNDGQWGSYGITHVKLETLNYLLDHGSMWETRGDAFRNLVSDDSYAIDMALLKLKSTEYKFHASGWKAWWTSYNGNNPEYGEDIANKVRQLKHCAFFEY